MSVEYLLEQKESVGVLFIGLLFGNLICFSGYRFVYILLSASGFFIGLTSAILVLSAIPNLSTEWIIAIAVVFGIIGSGISIFLLKSGIFILGVIGGVSLSIILKPVITNPLAVILFGILGGVSALIVEKPVIIFTTASLGGILIFWSVLHIIELLNWVKITSDFDPTYFHLISGLAWFGLTILGSAIQFRSAYSR